MRRLTIGLICILTMVLGAAGSGDSIAIAPAEVPVLVYHHLEPGAGDENGAIVSVAEFAAQMAWLKENGYTGITTAQLAAWLSGAADEQVRVTLARQQVEVEIAARSGQFDRRQPVDPAEVSENDRHGREAIGEADQIANILRSQGIEGVDPKRQAVVVGCGCEDGLELADSAGCECKLTESAEDPWRRPAPPARFAPPLRAVRPARYRTQGSGPAACSGCTVVVNRIVRSMPASSIRAIWRSRGSITCAWLSTIKCFSRLHMGENPLP